MAISFDAIPNTIRVPMVAVEFDSSKAVGGLGQQVYTVLLIGQRTAAGTAAALEFKGVTAAAQAATLFGPGSMLAHMCAKFLDNNPWTRLVAVALDDLPGAVAASATLTVTGAATAAGLLALYVAGHRIRVAVSSGDSADDVAAAVAAAIQADDTLPVTAAAVAGVVTLTARNKGLAGNGIDVRLNYYSDDALPAGIAVAVADMAGGLGNPDLADLIAAMGDTWYNVMCLPYTDAESLRLVEEELADRWGPMRQIEGLAFTAARGSHAELATLGNSRNSPHVSIMHCHGIMESPWEVAAAVSAVVAYYGNIDPARQMRTLPLSGITPPVDADRFTTQENNLLLYDGISTVYVDAGGVVRLQRVITTYKLSPAGGVDSAYLDIMTPLTLGYLRYDWRNYLLNTYPRHKLANDGTRYGVGQKIITPKVGKAEAVARYRLWEESGLVENAEFFKANIIVERNATDPDRLDFLMTPDLINNCMVVGVQMQFRLQVTAAILGA